MEWTTVLQKLANVKAQRMSHYLSVMRKFVEAGFKLATPALADAYAALIGDYDTNAGCHPYFTVRDSTYPEIRQTTKNAYGLFAYGTHARSEDIRVAVKELTRLHQKEIDAGHAWLMPVSDDDEYVSWHFDVFVGTEDEALETLRWATPLVKADINARFSPID